MAKIDLKPLTLSELKVLKSRLDKVIERHGKQQRTKALSAIKAKAKSMGFSLDDLTSDKTAKAKKTPAKKKAPSKIAYRHPEDPNLTWAGRGARPKWLKDALDQGKAIEDFKV